MLTIRKHLALLVVVVLAVSAASVGVVRSLKISPQTGSVPDLDLCRVGYAASLSSKVIIEDLKRSWLTWDTFDKTVSITRRERENLGGAWSEQPQELASSFYVLDVRPGCSVGAEIKTLFVAGYYPDGDACIEKWAFKPPKILPFPYLPLSQRPLPKVTRTEIYRGTAFGSIRCLEPDPEGRFLVFLTYETPTIYKLTLSTGAAEILLTDQAAPYLSSVKQIVVRHHATEGRHYHLMKGPRWEADLTDPLNVIALIDAENDGVFESTDTLSMTDWANRGYTLPGPFVDPCQ